MVERQVVALEVEGSSPSSYPITNRLSKELQTLSNINTILTCSKSKITIRNAVEYYSFILRSAKLPERYNPQMASHSARPKRWLSSSFKTFVNLSSYSSKRILIIHHSHLRDGLTNSWGNGGFSCPKSFFKLYRKFFGLVYSIIYYNIPKLIFTNNIFREEACSINWESLPKSTFIFKYNYHSIFFKPSKLDDKLPLLFRLFKQSGISSAFIVDSLYHSKNVYYLHRFNFYTIGLVEGNKPKYTLNTALPSLGDSIVGQLFFIRSLLLIRRLITLK